MKPHLAAFDPTEYPQIMANLTVTIELPEGLWKDIDFAAFQNEISPAALISRVMSAYLDTEDRKALDEALRQADADTDAGNLIDHEEVVRWFESVRLKASEAA